MGRLCQSEALLAAVNSKLEDGNIRAAVRSLCEGGQPAAPNEKNLKLLQEKHPLDPCPEALRAYLTQHRLCHCGMAGVCGGGVGGDSLLPGRFSWGP